MLYIFGESKALPKPATELAIAKPGSVLGEAGVGTLLGRRYQQPTRWAIIMTSKAMSSPASSWPVGGFPPWHASYQPQSGSSLQSAR